MTQDGDDRGADAAGVEALVSPAPGSPFGTYRNEDVRRLIGHAPLAWVIASDGFTASQLPLLGRYGERGELLEVVGHFAVNNPLRAAFEADRRATILFSGPQGYVSPSHAGNRAWGPTWNYAHVRLRAEMDVDAHYTDEALTLLADHVEKRSAHPWKPEELGARYGELSRHIIGFRGRVTECVARFKLGQDERPEVLASIIATHENADLVEWMRDFNGPSRQHGDGENG